MKKNLFYLFGAAAIMTLASCSNDEAENGQSSSAVQQIIPVSNVDVMSRAAQDVQSGSYIAADQAVGFFVTDGSKTSETTLHQDNISFTADSSGNFTGTTNLYFPASKSAGIYAYAPYAEGVSLTSTTNSFTVQTDQSTDANYLASASLLVRPKQIL